MRPLCFMTLACEQEYGVSKLTTYSVATTQFSFKNEYVSKRLVACEQAFGREREKLPFPRYFFRQTESLFTGYAFGNFVPRAFFPLSPPSTLIRFH